MRHTWTEREWSEWRSRQSSRPIPEREPRRWPRPLEALAVLSLAFNVAVVIGLIGLSQT